MSIFEERRTFGGLNSDDELRVIAPGDYRAALNIRIGDTEGQNLGALENVKGNTQISFPLPAGTNSCLGSVNDEKNTRTFYFIFNSNKDHSVFEYRYDTNTIRLILQDSLLNFKEDVLVTEADIVDDLLYWTEGRDNDNEPRQVNIADAFIEDKDVIYRIYSDTIFPGETFFTDGITYDITVDFGAFPIPPAFGLGSGFTVTEIYTASEVEGDREGFMRELARCLDQNASTSLVFDQIEGCGKYIEIRGRFEGFWTITLTSPSGELFRVVPQNYYGPTIKEEVINSIKAPPHCQPEISIVTDTNKKINLLSRNVFQFRASYEFKDFEHSALGPISDITFNPVLCGQDQVSSTANNLVKLDFTDERLNDPEVLPYIKKVRLYVRLGNLGVWKLITTLEQEDFGITENLFPFYNDNLYSPISQSEEDKLFDSLPQRAETQELIGSRMFYANLVEGYDAVCVDANVEVEYGEAPSNSNTFSISGTFRIENANIREATPLFSDFAEFQPIHADGGSAAVVWGGFAPSNRIDPILYQQTIPLKGFVPYLAGTDFYDVSVQNNPGGSGLPPEAVSGVWDSSTVSNRNDIRDLIRDHETFSTFEIQGVPPGEYILRVASHETTDSELADPLRAYQKTSTNVSSIAGAAVKELRVTVTNANVTIGEVIVDDLTGPLTSDHTIAMTGYVRDRDTGDQTTYPLIIADESIEFATIDFAITAGSGQGENVSPAGEKTDHNGYFFICARVPNFGGVEELSITNISSGTELLGPFVVDTADVVFVNVTGRKGIQLAAQNRNSDVTDFGRTHLLGSVTDVVSGFGLGGVTVVTTDGDTTVTDSLGGFELIIYANTPNATRSGTLVFSSVNSACITSFVPAVIPYGPLTISTGNFDDTNFPPSVSAVATLEASGSTRSAKRGGQYEFGLVYFDFANRSTAVNTSENLIVPINFYTEKDADGNLLPDGPVKLTWNILHFAPKGFTHYQWYRTKNLNTSDYVQFVAKEVKYVDQDAIEVPLADAVHIQLDLSNIVDYATRNPNSVVGIAPDTDYRVRFIRDAAGVLFADYFDLPVLKEDAGSVFIEKIAGLPVLDDGVLIEVYRPGQTGETKVFYEFSQCFAIAEEGKHTGPIQPQRSADIVDNFFAPGGNVGFTTVSSHLFLVGDLIYISQDKGYLNEQYNGYHTVVAVLTSLQFVIDVPFGVSTPPNPGLAIRPARGEFDCMDTFVRSRTMKVEGGSSVLTRTIETALVSDFYTSKDECIGRVGLVDADARQVIKEAGVRFSGKIFSGTEVNNLSTFDELNAEALDIEYGPVSKLQRAENVLLAIHEQRVNALYINEAIITSTAGEDQITKSSDVIGATRVLLGLYGTSNKESVAEYEGLIYWWDVKKGKVIRYGRNGLFPISDYKMRHFFSSLSRSYEQVPVDMAKLVTGVFDPFFNEYIMAVQQIDVDLPAQGDVGPIKKTLVPAQTISFSESLNRWVSNYSFEPEMMDRIGQDVITWRDGELFRHNANTIHGEFYGAKFNAEIEMVFNTFPKNVKAYRVISIESDERWEIEEMTIPPNVTYPEGMKTVVKSGVFDDREGILYAAIPGDQNDPVFTDPIDAQVNGRDMRGRTIRVLAVNSSDGAMVLYAININGTYSPRQQNVGADT